MVQHGEARAQRGYAQVPNAEAARQRSTLRVVTVLGLCVCFSSCGGCRWFAGRSMDKGLLRALIAEKLAMPGDELRFYQDHHHDWGNARELFFAEPGRGENLTAVLALDELPPNLDLKHNVTKEARQVALRRWEARSRVSGLSMIQEGDIADVRILRRREQRVEGIFSWKILSVKQGRGLFVAERRDGAWSLTYLGIAREGSSNRTHGYAVFPRSAGPYRAAGIHVSMLPDLEGCILRPPGDWVVLNINNDHVSARERGGPMDGRELRGFLARVVAERESLILRCSWDTAWTHVANLLSRMKAAGLATAWLSVETRQGDRRREAFIGIEPGKRGPSKPEATRLVRLSHRTNDPACDVYESMVIADWGDLRARAARLVPARKPPGGRVAIAPDDDVMFGWVVFVRYYLEQQGLKVRILKRRQSTGKE